MSDRRESTVRAAVVELATAAPLAPTWEDIERSARERPPARPAPRRVPAWAAATTSIAAVLASIGVTLWLVGDRSEPPVVPAATTMAEVPTTLAADTTVVEALLGEYYDAYNRGDADTAIGLLSGVMRAVPPTYLEFWITALDEQVAAECSPSPTRPGGVLCVETYTDAFHGPAGLTAVSHLLYFESNGRLLQTMDPSWVVGNSPGCFEGRCPDSRYTAFEEAMWGWLSETDPEIAASIGSAAQLSYSQASGPAIALALPFLDEFLTAHPSWTSDAAPGTDLSGLSALEAVEAAFLERNGRNPVTYEGFFGVPPDAGMQFLWGVGSTWLSECTPTEVPNQVRCTVEVVDGFYTRAGAVFRFTELWTLNEGRVSFVTEAETSSAWAFDAFEDAFGQWLSRAYPDEWSIAYWTPYGEMDPVPSAEAAAIVITRIDEFLEQSEEYPREPDTTNF